MLAVAGGWWSGSWWLPVAVSTCWGSLRIADVSWRKILTFKCRCPSCRCPNQRKARSLHCALLRCPSACCSKTLCQGQGCAPKQDRARCVGVGRGGGASQALSLLAPACDPRVVIQGASGLCLSSTARDVLALPALCRPQKRQM